MWIEIFSEDGAGAGFIHDSLEKFISETFQIAAITESKGNMEVAVELVKIRNKGDLELCHGPYGS